MLGDSGPQLQVLVSRTEEQVDEGVPSRAANRHYDANYGNFQTDL